MPQLTVTPSFVNPAKPGKKYASIKSNDGVYYSFDPAKIPLSTFQKNVPIDIEYTVTDSNGNTYCNIQRVRGGVQSQASYGPPVSGPQTPRAVDPNAMTKADWQAKDDKISRVAIAKSCIEANVNTDVADIWLAWVNQVGVFAPSSAQGNTQQHSDQGYSQSQPWEN